MNTIWQTISTRLQHHANRAHHTTTRTETQTLQIHANYQSIQIWQTDDQLHHRYLWNSDQPNPPYKNQSPTHTTDLNHPTALTKTLWQLRHHINQMIPPTT